jgi:sulfide:quinone oxidoreductase
MVQVTEINDRLSVAGQIDLADIDALAGAGYATIVNNRPDREEPGQLDHETAAAAAARHKLGYHYQPVTMGTIGRQEVKAFYDAVKAGPHRVLAHCRSGTRCYLLWTASQVLFENQSAPALVAEAAGKGYDLRALPALVEKIRAEG